jgi:hypothetical protein
MAFFLLSPIPFFFHSVPPFPYLFHPYYLPSVLIQYFSPFNCLPLLRTRSAPSFFSFRPIFVCSLLVPTSKSRHHFSLFCTFPPCQTLLILPVDSLSSFLIVSVFVPFTQLYIHPSSFCSQSFHSFTGPSIPRSLPINALSITFSNIMIILLKSPPHFLSPSTHFLHSSSFSCYYFRLRNIHF